MLQCGNTYLDTRGQWVDSGCRTAIHIWIHVASVVTVAAVWAIHLWIYFASVLTMAAVLAIHIRILVGNGVTVAAVRRYTNGYTWPVW